MYRVSMELVAKGDGEPKTEEWQLSCYTQHSAQYTVSDLLRAHLLMVIGHLELFTPSEA